MAGFCSGVDTSTNSTSGPLTQAQLDAIDALAGWSQSGGTAIFDLFPTTFSVTGQTEADALGLGQTITRSATTAAQPGTPGILASPALVIFAGGNITNSHLGVDHNSVSATAVSNQAVNTSTVNGSATVAGTTGNTTPLSGQALAGYGIIGPYNQFASGDHTLMNAQFAGGPASATAFSYHGIIALDPAAAINGSSLSVSDNKQQAAAEGNFAANSLSLSGANIGGVNTPVFTALSSTQAAGFENGAVANSASAMAIEAPGYITRSSLDLSRNSNTSLTIINDVSNKLAVSATNLTGGVSTPVPADPVAVTGFGLAPPIGASSGAFSVPVLGPYTSFAAATADHALASSQSVFFPGLVSSTATTVVRNNDAIIVGATDVTGNLVDSTANLDGNVTQAVTVGNRATSNALEISASANNGASGALTNAQTALGDAQFSALANSSVSYTGGVGNGAGNVTNSSLSLNGNVSRADSVANSAVNSLSSIAGTNQAGTNGLMSAQYSFIGGEGGGQVTATANGSVSVGLGNDVSSANPSSVSTSTISLSGNRVVAVATANDATNTLVSRGTNVIGDMSVDATAGNSGPFGGAVATNALTNVQWADHNGVQATATNTVAANVGTAALASGAISNSTVVMDGNITVAQAGGNSARNTLTVDASANLSATAALTNVQFNDGPIGATANSVIGLNGGIATQTPVALSNSTASISDNVTQAFATGNDATNAVNFLAGAGYNVAAIVNQAVAGTGGASGSVALFNAQQNGGSVTATANGTNYQVALNALNTAVQNSTINISGNQLKSQAIGNFAANTITTTALNTGTPTMALATNQVNSGNITATTTANFGVNIAGLTSSSTLRQVGNSLSATAIGNAVTNVITAR